MRLLRNSLCLLATCIAALPGHAWEPVWVLEPCPPEARARAAELATALRSAAPGSENWLPHPYPKTAAQVFEDFASQVRKSWEGKARSHVPVPERRLLRLLKQPSSLNYEVIPVAEWRPQRCGRVYGETHRIFLLRLFEAGTGVEFGRFTLHESGLIGVLDFNTDPVRGLDLRDGHRLESIAVAPRRARQSSLEPESLQYVAAASPSIPCYDTVPCVAFRQGERVFLYRTGRLFELQHRKVQIARDEFIREGPERERAVAALGKHDHLVALGAELMTTVVPVDPR